MAIFDNPYLFMVKTAWNYSKRVGGARNFLAFYSLSIVANCGTLGLAYILGMIFDTVQRNPPDLMRQLMTWLLIYAAISFSFWALHGPSRVIERRLAFRIKRHFVDEMYAKVKEMPMKWHQDHHSGDTINRINKASSALYNFCQEQFLFIGYTLMFIGPLVILSFLSWKVALIATISGVFTGFLMGRFDRVLVPLLLDENNRDHKFASAFFDYVSNITTIISLRIGERTREELGRRVEHIYAPLKRSITVNEFKWFTLTICRVAIEVAILMYYIWSQLQTHSTLQIGLTVMVYQYLRRLSETFVGFAATYERLIRWRTDFTAVDFLRQGHAALPTRPEREQLAGWQQITIRNIRFSYEDREHHHHQLQDVSLDIRRGQKIALVGESGSGKSTLLGLLRGIYETEHAELSHDGGPVLGQGLAALSRHTTLIPQEPEIFENSIRYNITTGIKHTDEELHAAIEIASFDNVVKRLDFGTETDIREKGVNLSGGEKQRLALARGVFAARQSASSLILLDEPTSSVDSTTERRIYGHLFKSFPDCAMISSIHRLHLLESFDMIYVMAGGRVVEEGNLPDLLDKRGAFSAMWKQYHKTHTGED